MALLVRHAARYRSPITPTEPPATIPDSRYASARAERQRIGEKLSGIARWPRPARAPVPTQTVGEVGTERLRSDAMLDRMG